MEGEGRRAASGGAYGRPYGTPYVAAVELTAEEPEPEPEPINPAPAAPYARWIRSINEYVRRETTFTEGNRFG
jgi:hypothetical protein